MLSIGFIGTNVTKAIAEFEAKDQVAHYAVRFVKPLDEPLLHQVFKSYEKVITVEDGVITGGFGSAVLEFAAAHSYTIPVTRLGIDDYFVEQGSTEQLQDIVGISVDRILETLRRHVN